MKTDTAAMKTSCTGSFTLWNCEGEHFKQVPPISEDCGIAGKTERWPQLENSDLQSHLLLSESLHLGSQHIKTARLR